MIYWCVICDEEVTRDDPPMCDGCNDYDGIVEVENYD